MDTEYPLKGMKKVLLKHLSGIGLPEIIGFLNAHVALRIPLSLRDFKKDLRLASRYL